MKVECINKKPVNAHQIVIQCHSKHRWQKFLLLLPILRWTIFSKLHCTIRVFWILMLHSHTNIWMTKFNIQHTGPLNYAKFYIFHLSSEGLNSSHMVAHISFGKQVYKELRRDLLMNMINLACNYNVEQLCVTEMN